MIRVFLLLSIGATLYANSDYVPFSKFSKSDQVKYNFNKIEVDYSKKIEIRKPIVQEVTKIKETNLVVEKEQIQQALDEKQLQNETSKSNTIQKTRYNKDILYSARLTYSPLSTKLDDLEKDNSTFFEPSGAVSFGNHRIEANYFKSENGFFSNLLNIETIWYKLAYKHNYKNVNFGLAFNHLIFDTDLFSKEKETFPSFEIDFKNSLDYIDFEYGGSVGIGNNIDYSYEYFFNVNIKPSMHSNESFVVGYKNRTFNIKNIINDELKVEFAGPFIGVNVNF